ncbi:Disease resistance protein L6 [Linum perenne]
MEYEVFLSFRGPDVRTNFADFLYKYLGRSNIRTFLDDEELRKGEEIAPSLLKAIEESKVYIPIISRGYASSKWCLQELAKMAECCGDRGSGGCHILLPIFYMVEPRDVRHVEEGSFVRAFQRHSDKYSVETVQEWRKALQEVGRMKGWHVTESDRQGAIIDQVFFKVWSKLRMDYMLVTDDLIGMDSHLAKMKELLQLDYKGVKVIGIHGMGGIGKTTIAKALYNEFRGRFDRCCFVEDVRETLSTKIDGVVSLQRKIVRNILQLSECKVEDSNEGIHIIKNRVCKHKVLIVLDDVDYRFKFDNILGKLEDFGSGSRFIVTTRDKRMDESEEFWMHDHLIDLGKSIVREEDVECPWKRSRIWCNEDALDILAHKKGTDRLKAIRIEIRDKTFKLTESHFANLSQLRYLKVVNGNFEGNFETILPNIRWLEMWGCNSNPMNCDMKKLVVFDLHVSRVTNGWIGWENIKGLPSSLINLEIKSSKALKKLPSLGNLCNLRVLFLWETSMREIPGLGKLGLLTRLILEKCDLLVKLPDLSCLKQLQFLDILGCTQLTGVCGVENLECLIKVTMDERLKVNPATKVKNVIMNC